MKKTKLNFGTKGGVCLDCKKILEKAHYEESIKKSEEIKQQSIQIIKKNYHEIIQEINQIFPPFNKKIEVTLKNLYILKMSYVKNDEVLREEFLINQTQFYLLTQSSIDGWCSLTEPERKEWKELYQKNFSFQPNYLIVFFNNVKKFLVSLVNKYKDEEEKSQTNNLLKCQNCKLHRENPENFPVGCEHWCKGCIELKTRQTNMKMEPKLYQELISHSFPSNPPKNSLKDNKDKNNFSNSDQQSSDNLPSISPDLYSKDNTKTSDINDNSINKKSFLGIIGAVIMMGSFIFFLIKKTKKQSVRASKL